LGLSGFVPTPRAVEISIAIFAPMSPAGPIAANGARATIVVVPRERFSKAAESLESIYASTDTPFELVYVDGGSPRRLREWLAVQAEQRGFRLLRFDRYLSPNEARNLGFAEVDTEYVVFIDNDVLVQKGWLARLIECADETEAAVVSPLICEDGFDRVHFAGGEVGITEEEAEDGGLMRRVHDRIRFHQREMASVSSELHREECGLCEFHCVLARSAVVEHIGRLDERLMSTREHLDFCLAIAETGGSVWVEPRSVVAYLTPPPLDLTDLHFYSLRWSDDWERRSLRRFREKWGLADDDFFKARLNRLGWRRHNTILAPIARRLTPGGGRGRVASQALKLAERPVNRFLTSRHARHRARAAG
jgi:GT2 family glycosyltransferase